eukprot:4963256-Pyramimonas_sp.AAC.1
MRRAGLPSQGVEGERGADATHVLDRAPDSGPSPRFWTQVLDQAPTPARRASGGEGAAAAAVVHMHAGRWMDSASGCTIDGQRGASEVRQLVGGRGGGNGGERFAPCQLSGVIAGERYCTLPSTTERSIGAALDERTITAHGRLAEAFSPEIAPSAPEITPPSSGPESTPFSGHPPLESATRVAPTAAISHERRSLAFGADGACATPPLSTNESRQAEIPPPGPDWCARRSIQMAGSDWRSSGSRDREAPLRDDRPDAEDDRESGEGKTLSTRAARPSPVLFIADALNSARAAPSEASKRKQEGRVACPTGGLGIRTVGKASNRQWDSWSDPDALAAPHPPSDRRAHHVPTSSRAIFYRLQQRVRVGPL